MLDLIETQIFCPYCGESIPVLVDPCEVGDSYIEDCQVCCAPIEFHILENGGQIRLEVFTQDDA